MVLVMYLEREIHQEQCDDCCHRDHQAGCRLKYACMADPLLKTVGHLTSGQLTISTTMIAMTEIGRTRLP